MCQHFGALHMLRSASSSRRRRLRLSVTDIPINSAKIVHEPSLRIDLRFTGKTAAMRSMPLHHSAATSFRRINHLFRRSGAARRRRPQCTATQAVECVAGQAFIGRQFECMSAMLLNCFRSFARFSLPSAERAAIRFHFPSFALSKVI